MPWIACVFLVSLRFLVRAETPRHDVYDVSYNGELEQDVDLVPSAQLHFDSSVPRELSNSWNATEVPLNQGRKKADVTSLTSAALLIGIIAFVTTLFYLANNKSHYIRHATWDLLSDALSVFCAVLWYQALEAILDKHLSADDQWVVRFIIGLLHFWVWYIAVQSCNLWLCDFERFGELPFRSSCVLGAHLSGFAAKSAFNTLMQAKPFRGSVGTALLALVLSLVFMITLMHLCHKVRHGYLYPRMDAHLNEICNKGTREADNDMLSLSIGFCVSQVLRFVIHGTLPRELMPHDRLTDITYWEAWSLFGFAILFGSAAVGIVKLESMYSCTEHRYIEFTKLTFVMSMAWDILFCAEWNVMLMFGDGIFDRKVLARVILALMISYFSMVVIFSLDTLAERSKSKLGKETGRLFAKGFGLAVAFSWEITFDVSVETIADSRECPVSEPVMKLLMASFLVTMVAPAWATYVLPNAIEELRHYRRKQSSSGEVGESAPEEIRKLTCGAKGNDQTKQDEEFAVAHENTSNMCKIGKSLESTERVVDANVNSIGSARKGDSPKGPMVSIDDMSVRISGESNVQVLV